MAQVAGEHLSGQDMVKVGLDSVDSVGVDTGAVDSLGGVAGAASSNKSVSQALGLTIPNYSDAELDSMEFPPGPVSPDALRYFGVRTLVDRVLAGILLVVVSPVLLLCMAAIRLNSKGSPIFSQRRTGAGGKTFTMYKLRSMYQDAEQKSGPQWSQPGDARVTVVGRFLRFAQLDEIPQLINVVRGEMALIGPRPERPSIVKELIPLVPSYVKRHAAKPGITGLAQIYLPPDENIDSVKAKVIYDLIYLRHVTWVMDLRIAICTVLRMFAIRGGMGPRWTGLSQEVEEIRRLNRERAKQRMQNQAATNAQTRAGELRMQRLNRPEHGIATLDSGITNLIGESMLPDYANAKRPPREKRRRSVSHSKPR